MNNNEIWHRWEPIKADLNGNYYIDLVEQSHNGFRILLEQEDTAQKIEILFTGLVLAYRGTEEGVRFHLFTLLSEEYGTEFYAQWTFFKVENSSYIKWVSGECYGVVDNLEPMHFVIMGLDLVLDIVASYEPQVTILPATSPKLGAETARE